MFDLNVYQINLTSSIEKPALPGVFTFTAQKHAARGRETDKLMGYLRFSEFQAITFDLLQQWLKEAATLFYRTPGTVTAAMRMVIDHLNGQIMDRNLHGNESGAPQLVGSLSLAVEHHNLLYYTSLGSTRSFVIRAQEVEAAEIDPASRGLGVSRTLVPRFQQSELAAGDLILFSANPPASWTAASLAGSTTLAADALRRRLFNQAGPDLQAVVFQFAEGNGRIEQKAFRPISAVPSQPAVVQKKVEPLPVTPAAGDITGASSSNDAAVVPMQSSISAHPDKEPPEPVQAGSIKSGEAEPISKSPEQAILQSSSTGVKEPQSQSNEVKKSAPTREAPLYEKRSFQTDPSAQKNSTVARDVNQAEEFFRKWIAKILQLFVPRGTDGSPKLSRSLMLIISIAVPLIVVTVGATVYNQLGRTQEIEAYLGQAKLSVAQADSQAGDATAQLSSLQQAMFWLEKVEEAGQSEEASILKTQVQARLDSMNGVLRLQLSSALADVLPEETHISRLLTVGTDLYALDQTSGKAMRFIQTGQLYQRDVNFDCGPNDELSGAIGALVDIVPLEANAPFGATILGIDGSGNLEYCVPSDTGNITKLALPDAGWGKIQAMALSEGTLYVLDTRGNAVYLYEGNGSEFAEKPVLFFDNQVPALGEALDIVVNGDELYILRSSGEMVECTYSYLKALKSTECEDPAPYGDMRTGQNPQTITFTGTQFTQLEITDAPDSSLYLLDTIGKTLYHFSLQRNLQEVFNPTLAEGLDMSKMTPTAFAVSNGRMVYLAFGNEIQFVQLP